MIRNVTVSMENIPVSYNARLMDNCMVKKPPPSICMSVWKIETGEICCTTNFEPADLRTLTTVFSGDAWLGRKSLAQYELPASAFV